MGNTTRKNSTPIKGLGVAGGKGPYRGKRQGYRQECLVLSSSGRGLGYQPKSVLDHRAIEDLAKVNADLGRLGGLLKMWLANDEKLAMYEPVQIQQTIHGVLVKIGEVQLELLEKVKKI